MNNFNNIVENDENDENDSSNQETNLLSSNNTIFNSQCSALVGLM